MKEKRHRIYKAYARHNNNKLIRRDVKVSIIMHSGIKYLTSISDKLNNIFKLTVYQLHMTDKKIDLILHFKIELV